MTHRLIFVFVFTLIIHLISTLSYSVRLVGIRTGRIAVSFALFNILMLVSRTANSFQAPLLAKFVEQRITQSSITPAPFIFSILISAASLGTLAGAFLFPTFQNILTSLVWRFNADRSVAKIILHSFSKIGTKQIRDRFRVPSKDNIAHFKDLKKMPKKLLLLNAVVVGTLTIGSFSALLAAFEHPEIRLTCSTLAPIITGFATVLLVVFIDPFFSLMTDDCIEGKVSFGSFHRAVVLFVTSRFIGTMAAQVLLYPAAYIVSLIAKSI